MIFRLDVRIIKSQEDEVRALLTEICNSRFLWRITDRKPKPQNVYYSPDKTVEFYGKHAKDNRLQFKLAFQETKYKEPLDAGAFYTPYTPLSIFQAGRVTGKSTYGIQQIGRSLRSLHMRSQNVINPFSGNVGPKIWEDVTTPKVIHLDPALPPVPTMPSPFAIAIAASELKDEDRK